MLGRRDVLILSASLAATACTKTTHPMGSTDVSDKRFQQFKSVIEAWTRKDVDAVMAAMDEDIVWHYAAAIAPPARGKVEARAFLDRFGPGVLDVRWRIFEHAETADRLFVEGVDEYTTPDGTDVAAPYAGVIEFKGDKIVGWRDYIDRAVIDSMKAGNPYPDQVKELINRPAK